MARLDHSIPALGCCSGDWFWARAAGWLKPLAFALLLGFCGLVDQPSAMGQTPNEQVVAHFRAGQAALKQGNLTQATEEFKKVLALDPNLVEAQVNLGLAYHALGEYRLSATNLAAALRQRPELAGPSLILGIDYLKLDDAEKAIPALQRALQLDSSNREAHRALAMCYVSREEFRQAADEDRELARLAPDQADAWFTLGHDYINLAAHMAFRGAEVYRGSAWGNRFLGDMLFQRNRWEDAAEEYLHALEVDPKQPGLQASFGQAYLHDGKMDKAVDAFRAEIELASRNEPAWLGIAETQLAGGHAAAALEAVQKAWQISPEFVVLQQGFPSLEPSPDAAKMLVAELLSAPESAAKHFLLAGLDPIAGDAPRADEQAKALQADFLTWQKAGGGAAPDQDSCSAHRYVACAQWLASRKSPTHQELLLLGKTQFTLRQFGHAADTLAGLLAIDKGNVEASYWLARTYQALGAECYDRLEAAYPDSWRAHQLRAESFNAREAYNDALQEYQLALQLRPDQPDLHEALGDTYLNKKAYDQAASELEACLRLDPTRPRALFLLGRLYMARHETEKAVPCLQKALRFQPDMAEASNVLGTAYVRLGQDAKAIPELQKAASVDFYGDVHYELFVAYRRLGRMDLANQALKRSEELRHTSAARHQAMVSGVTEVQ